MATENEFVQLKQTKGTFEVVGQLFNVTGENTLKAGQSTNGKEYKIYTLGLRISDSERMFLTLNGMEQDYVYFGKSMAKKGEKAPTERVEWAKRKSYADSHPDEKAISVQIGIVGGEDGKNIVEHLVAFDAIEYLQANAENNMSVRVIGNIEFNSYEDKNTKELKKNVKFVPTRIYREYAPVDFQSEKFEKYAEFVQQAVYKGVRREAVGDEFEFYVDILSIGYKSYEDSSLLITDSLAKLLKDNMKANWMIPLTGKIKSNQTVEVVDADVWGESSKVGKAKTPSRVTLLVDGARNKEMDKETYTSKTIDAYRVACDEIKAKKGKKEGEFESQDGGAAWGAKSGVKTEQSAWD